MIACDCLHHSSAPSPTLQNTVVTVTRGAMVISYLQHFISLLPPIYPPWVQCAYPAHYVRVCLSCYIFTGVGSYLLVHVATYVNITELTVTTLGRYENPRDLET